MMYFKIFSSPLLGMLWVLCFVWANTFVFDTISLVITITNGYCVYNKWYLHSSGHSHCWSNFWKSYFVSHFLFNSCDNCSLGKGRVILWSIPWEWFHSSYNKNIWIFASTCKWLPSLMCQHDMVDKRFWKSLNNPQIHEIFFNENMKLTY